MLIFICCVTHVNKVRVLIEEMDVVHEWLEYLSEVCVMTLLKVITVDNVHKVLPTAIMNRNLIPYTHI